MKDIYCKDKEEQLIAYCLEVRCIDGLDTYIIAPEFYEQVISKEVLSGVLNIKKSMHKDISGYIKTAKEVKEAELFFAFMYLERWNNLEWVPVNCLKHGEEFYHVFCCETWMCRECGYMNHGTVIMPLVESEPIYYQKRPEIAPIFKKQACKNCGKLLQNHLILIN